MNADQSRDAVTLTLPVAVAQRERGLISYKKDKKKYSEK